MSYSFTAASSQYLTEDYNFSVNMPIAMSCWIKISATPSATQRIMGVQAFQCTNGRMTMIIDTSRRILATHVTKTNSYTATSFVSVQLNTWTHVLTRFTNDLSRNAFVNGASGSNSTQAVGGQDPFTVIQIGASNYSVFFDGSIANVGIWERFVTNDEITSLAKGIACNKINNNNLVFYAPLIRNLNDLKGGQITNMNGSTQSSDHPRIYI
jgi:hypothetical protein